MSPSIKAHSKCRAITIVELLVAIAITSIVGGLVIAIFVNTNIATKRQQRENNLVNEANNIVSIIRKNFRHQALATSDANELLVWKSKQCVFPVQMNNEKSTCAISEIGISTDTKSSSRSIILSHLKPGTDLEKALSQLPLRNSQRDSPAIADLLSL